MPDSAFPSPEGMGDAIMDLAVIGAGLAGLAAGVFAVNRGLSTARLGSTGTIAYTAGYLDILGLPTAGCALKAEPREGLKALLRQNPDHPYGKAGWKRIEAAFREFTEFLEDAGLPYVVRDKNQTVFSSMGTAKTTWAVPATMLAGVDAFAKRLPCLLVDFTGLKAFSAREIAAALGVMFQ